MPRPVRLVTFAELGPTAGPEHMTVSALLTAEIDDGRGITLLDDWVPALVFGDAVIIDGFTTRLKGCDRKDRVTLFDDNRFDTCWLDK